MFRNYIIIYKPEFDYDLKIYCDILMKFYINVVDDMNSGSNKKTVHSHLKLFMMAQNILGLYIYKLVAYL